ncbi:MAG: hypothetical protein Q8L60_16835 [Gammaproteobacteria bacterium]|nr:hypothetical protein [Gammaproteobacteria bacterium]MDP2140674.1 hypothetical protein [Gammaproteobacteria bacterium]MDP2346933.1 hypothetical protein [Gammaproteobacteria bacterium]
MKPLVVIHGWSDEASSFLPLASAIEQVAHRPVQTLFLGNYVSLDDDVQMKDLVQGLTRAWKREKLPTSPGSVDVIIHSTGGLVVRDWMHSEYTAQNLKPPISNLVMLAPANFGSPLAHKGRAVYGRVLKGFNSAKRFQTGGHILKALEMASPYTWDLAQRDRFDSNALNASGVRTTVIVGNRGYGGVSSLANEPGSDGTVYVSTANLNCAHVEIHFPAGDRIPRVKSIKTSKGETAFLVMEEFDHSSIALKDDNHKDKAQLLGNIITALSISSAAQFKQWVTHCDEQTTAVLKANESSTDDYKHGFQNTVFRVMDDHGYHVLDYVIEFYHDVERGFADTLAALFNKKAVSKVHAYGDNAAYRSFMINCTALYKIIKKEKEALRISLSAMPDLSDENTLVGYRSFGNNDIGQVDLKPAAIPEFFAPNRTLFVDITLTREQKDELFWIRNVEDVD